MNRTLVQRWQSRSGKHWIELYRDDLGFFYEGNDCGGNLGNVTEAQARDEIETRIVMWGTKMKAVAAPPQEETNG